MTTSRTASKSKSSDKKAISNAKKVYFRDRLKDNIFSVMLTAFSEAQEKGLTKKDLATLIDKKPEQITRIFSAPGNLTLDTVSDILLGMESELAVSVKKFSDYLRHNETSPQWLEVKSFTSQNLANQTHITIDASFMNDQLDEVPNNNTSNSNMTIRLKA